jgi:bacterioferritin (cytochrome b1)
MDVEEELKLLNRCLSLQYRSVLQLTLTSGSLFGFEFQSLGDRIWADAEAEINDLRLLVEKITALGGSPTTDVPDLKWSGDAEDAVQWIVDTETELVDALKDAIEPTGQEGRSEALEHVLEHIIMRKQNQIDFLLRARRTS